MSGPQAPQDASANAILFEMGQVKGMLQGLTTQIQSNHEATKTRIEDLKQTVDTRFTAVEKRLSSVEANERATALRTAGAGALSGAIVTAAIEAFKHLPALLK